MNSKADTALNWTWLRNLIKVVEDLHDIPAIVTKVQESFTQYLGFEATEIYIVEDPQNNQTTSEKTYADKLATSSFFNRSVIEEIFLHKRPCRKSEDEIIFPLEVDDRILGLIYIKTGKVLDEFGYELLWSFADQLAERVNQILLPQHFNIESKAQIRELSNTIFNNLKSFLEASLERLKLLEEQNLQLVELNRTRTELINNVSHELRTPLVSIMGFSNILQRHEISAELVQEASQQIQSAGSRLSRMIDDLIQLNRASTKGWEINIEKLDIGEIARFVVSALSPLHKDHQFTFSYTGEYPLIDADRKLLRQVIENLTINAIKYSPDGGEINYSINLDNHKQKLFLAISDNGIGMTEEEHSKIFERFYRAKNQRTENISGLGLGLTICKDIVEALNGKIESESKFGQGSIFTISFGI